MKVTGERMTLEAGFTSDLEKDHRARYEYASQFVKGLDVVDIACGSGYGSAMLAEAGAQSVRGFDLSADAVEYASEKFGHTGVLYAPGDATNLAGIPSNSVDVVCSFETIEHIPDDRKYLDEMHRILKPGGLYLVSTPDRRLASTRYPLRGKPNNPFHVREYVREEFINLVKTRFDVEQVSGQAFISSFLVFWPLQVFLKGSCYYLKRFGAYGFIRKVYHLGSGLHVQSCPNNRCGARVARYWVLKCRKPG